MTLDQERIKMTSNSSLGVDLTHLHPLSPFRPPDWRSKAAGLLATPGCRSRRRWLDAEVRRATRWLRLATKLGEDHPRVARLDPELAAALALHRNPSQRLALEAYLLADMASEEIAQRLGLSPEVIDVFERVLFDVRARLACSDYIHFLAVSPDGDLWRGEPSIETIVRMLAFGGGPVVADVALAMALGGAIGSSVAEAELTRRFGLLFGLLRVAADGREAAQLIRLDRLQADLARRASDDLAPMLASALLRDSIGMIPAPIRTSVRAGATEVAAVDSPARASRPSEAVAKPPATAVDPDSEAPDRRRRTA